MSSLPSRTLKKKLKKLYRLPLQHASFTSGLKSFIICIKAKLVKQKWKNNYREQYKYFHYVHVHLKKKTDIIYCTLSTFVFRQKYITINLNINFSISRIL